MAQNKAAEELAALTQSVQGADTNARQMAATDRERGTHAGMRALDPDGDGEASFALPEALATAVGAGWLLGPAGGLALGIAQGILGKREKQNALDLFAAEQDAISDIQQTLGGQFDVLEANTTNANDIEQLAALRTQQDAAFQMMKSGSPSIQQKGMEMLATVQDQVNGYTDQQETQRIEQEAIDAQIARELDKDQRDLFVSELDKHETKSDSFIQSVEKSGEVRRHLENGTPASLSAALVGIVKLQDPTSAAMEGEVNAWRGIGNLSDKLMGYVNQLDEGQPLTSGQAKDMLGLVDNIMAERTRIQLSRQSRVRDRLDAAGLPQKYWDEFDIVSDYPDLQKYAVAWTTGTEDVQDAGQTAIVDAIEATVNTASDTAEAVKKGAAAVTREFGAFNEAASYTPAWPRNTGVNQ